MYINWLWLKLHVYIIIYKLCIICSYLCSTQRLFKHLLFEESFTRY